MQELTKENIDDSERKYLNNSVYSSHENIIKNFFHSYPKNDDVNIVIVKIILVDYTYSTQLSMIRNKLLLSNLAEIIVGIKDFNYKIAIGDKDVVKELLDKLPINIFSFVTKYCALHNVYVYNRDDFSIYDSEH